MTRAATDDIRLARNAALRVRAGSGSPGKIGPNVVWRRAVPQADAIMVGVSDLIHRSACTNDQVRSGNSALIQQRVTHRDPALERRSIARVHDGLVLPLDHRDLALQHVDQLIFRTVPVLDRRLRPGLKHLNKRAELTEPTRLTDPLFLVRRPARRGRYLLDEALCGRDDGHGCASW